ncbi:hypothetical protein DM860_009075 [Cuscuta australis]|uniref:Uncharacterized protein n=1 Tax=Cuscuta australis TaxID=267555 RepID=A0A328DDA9_9ASTE|nr:hypothetical protein DM860_009075 [Cuscuta australis]
MGGDWTWVKGEKFSVRQKRGVTGKDVEDARKLVEEFIRHGMTEKASVINHALAEQEFITGYIWDRLVEANPEYFQLEEAAAGA